MSVEPKAEVKEEVKEEVAVVAPAESDAAAAAVAAASQGTAAPTPTPAPIGGASAQASQPPGMPIGHLNPAQSIAGLGASAPRLPAAGAQAAALGAGLMLPTGPAMAERPPVMASSEPSPLSGQQLGPLAGGLPAAGAQPAGPSQPYRQLKVEDALAYLDKVKMKFDKQPHIYNQVSGHQVGWYTHARRMLEAGTLP
jgi:hypothetical protein